MLDESIRFFEEFSDHEHDCAVAFHTNPDQNEFWASMAPLKDRVESPWFPAGFTGREFGFFGTGELPSGFTKRVLLAVESYHTPDGHPLFIGYFGEMNSTQDSHMRLSCRRFARPLEHSSGEPGLDLRLFGEEQKCAACSGSGEVVSSAGVTVCESCHGRGWKLYKGVGDKPECGERLDAREICRSVSERDQPAWNKMFPNSP